LAHADAGCGLTPPPPAKWAPFIVPGMASSAENKIGPDYLRPSNPDRLVGGSLPFSAD